MRTVVYMQQVNGRPDTQYGWYAVGNSWRYMAIRQAGWEPVTGDHAREIFGDAYEHVKDANGYVVYKGLVLHSRPMDLKLREDYEGMLRRAQRRQIPRDKFLEELDKVPHLKAFVYDSVEEYADRKKHDLGQTAPQVSVPAGVESLVKDPVAAAAKELKSTQPPPPPAKKTTPTPGPTKPTKK